MFSPKVYHSGGVGAEKGWDWEWRMGLGVEKDTAALAIAQFFFLK
jgi:hypothetical protein